MAKNLKAWVKARGYKSIESFALQNSIDNSILSRLVNDQRSPSLDTLVKIALALEVSLDDLLPLTKKKS